jgi:S1-C subfamily serine protease
MGLFDEYDDTFSSGRRPAAVRRSAPATRPLAPPAPPTPPPPAAGRLRLPAGIAGLFVTLAVVVGILIGHAAWSSSPGSGSANPPSLFGSAGVNPSAPTGSGSTGSSGATGPSGGSTANPQPVAAKVDPALVDINTTLGFQGAEGAGTGIVLTADGEILTNNHVIDGASSIRVTDVGNGRTYDGTVIGYDRSKDIAVVQLKNASGLATATLGDSSTAVVGQPVIAVGNAGGSGSTPTTAPGTITGLNRSITAANELDGTSERLTGLIEVDANVQPGDSGGSLVNGAGEVIGVDTAASAGFSFRTGTSQGYAIPINQALAIAKQIVSGQSSPTVHIGPTALLGVETSSGGAQAGGGRFGFGYGDGTGSSPTAGAVVVGVVDGGAAQHAGLANGDVITQVNGQSIGSPDALSRAITALKPGDSVAVGWTDAAGQSHTATVTLGTGPPA